MVEALPEEESCTRKLSEAVPPRRRIALNDTCADEASADLASMGKDGADRDWQTDTKLQYTVLPSN